MWWRSRRRANTVVVATPWSWRSCRRGEAVVVAKPPWLWRSCGRFEAVVAKLSSWWRVANPLSWRSRRGGDAAVVVARSSSWWRRQGRRTSPCEGGCSGGLAEPTHARAPVESEHVCMLHAASDGWTVVSGARWRIPFVWRRNPFVGGVAW